MLMLTQQAHKRLKWLAKLIYKVQDLTKVDLCEINFAKNFKSNILKLKLGTFAVRN